jgi:hypothetical protein
MEVIFANLANDYLNQSDDMGASGAGGLDNKTSISPETDQDPDSNGIMKASPEVVSKFPCFSV